MSIHGYQKLIKVLLVGDSTVGKSSLTSQFTESTFADKAIPTIGLDFKTKILTIKSKSIKLLLYDSAGQERFRNICTSYYSTVKGIVFVYDVTKPETFTNIESFIRDAQWHVQTEIPMILIGNKADLPRSVSKKDGERLAKRYGMKFYETSARHDFNVNEAFTAMANMIMGKNETHIKVKIEQKDSLIMPRVVKSGEKNRECTNFFAWLFDKVGILET